MLELAREINEKKKVPSAHTVKKRINDILNIERYFRNTNCKTENGSEICTSN